MKYPGLLLFFLFVAIGSGCATAITPGTAALPEGMAIAQVPNLDIGGFVYYASEPPLVLKTNQFFSDVSDAPIAELEETNIELRQATMVFGTSLDEFGGSMSFVSEADAQHAWSVLSSHGEATQIWSELASDQVLLANVTSDWGRRVQSALQSSATVSLEEHDPVAWDLVTNLPESPPSMPVAVGVMKLDQGVLENLEDRAGILLSDIGNAFGFVKVDTLGFGVYSDSPVEVSVRIDEKFLQGSDSSVLFISQSGYPGGLVAFMLSVIGGRTNMDLITLGDTNARYRQIDDLHLVLKNRGSLIFAAVANTRVEAETLMLSALEN